MMADDILTARLILRLIPQEALIATAAQNIKEAALILGFDLPEAWRDFAPLAKRRLAQLADCPRYRPWSVRALIRRQSGAVLGYVNFHDLPSWHEVAQKEACVEFGYKIFASHRRQGYAEEAVRCLMDWARERGARHFIFSISPENTPSLALALKLGARKIGVQIDEEDGPEDVFLLK